MEVKKCKDCQDVKPITEFYSSVRYWRKKTKDWGVTYDSCCKPCKHIRQKKSDASDPDRAARIKAQQKEYHKAYNRKKYNRKARTLPGHKTFVRDTFGKMWQVVSIVAQPDDGTEIQKLLFSVKEIEK